MNKPDFRGALEDYLRTNANPTHKYGHQPRLYALTQQVGSGLTYDDDVVYAAVYLHDLGVFVGYRPKDPAALKTWDHVAYILARTPAILTEAGFPTEKIPAVIEVIRTHQPQDTPTTPEATIARDADILEQLGAIGITRTLAKLGSDNRFHTFTEARNALRKQLEALPPKLILEPAKVIAIPRIAALKSFLESLDAEAGVHLH